MKKIIFFCGIIICSITAIFATLVKHHTTSPPGEVVISCNAKINLEINQPEELTHMEGRLGLTTLGNKRLALLFTGRLITPEGRFILSRTLLMNYLYHPDNHMLELTYENSSVNTLDTTPDDIFNRTLMKNRSLILSLDRFNDRAWLISGLMTPMYICNDD